MEVFKKMCSHVTEEKRYHRKHKMCSRMWICSLPCFGQDPAPSLPLKVRETPIPLASNKPHPPPCHSLPTSTPSGAGWFGVRGVPPPSWVPVSSPAQSLDSKLTYHVALCLSYCNLSHTKAACFFQNSTLINIPYAGDIYKTCGLRD